MTYTPPCFGGGKDTLSAFAKETKIKKNNPI
jgi:hypothetical protein